MTVTVAQTPQHSHSIDPATLTATAKCKNGLGNQQTSAGQQLHTRIRVGVAQITERLWGDLPAADLETAARVLTIVLDRAGAEFASLGQP